MGQVHVLTGVIRRRRWSDAEKRALVAAAFAPGAVISEVARRADVNTGQLYRWRKELRSSPATGFAPVVVSAGPPAAGDSAGSAIEVAVGADARVRIGGSVSPDLAAAVIKALARP